MLTDNSDFWVVAAIGLAGTRSENALSLFLSVALAVSLLLSPLLLSCSLVLSLTLALLFALLLAPHPPSDFWVVAAIGLAGIFETLNPKP